MTFRTFRYVSKHPHYGNDIEADAMNALLLERWNMDMSVTPPIKGAGLFVNEVQAEVLEYGEFDPLSSPVTVVTSCANQANATLLSAHTWVSTGAEKQAARFIMIDNGSSQPYNWGHLKSFASKRTGRTTCIRFEKPVGHAPAIDLLAQNDVIGTKFWMMVDNDIEVLDTNFVSKMVGMVEGHFAAGIYLPSRPAPYKTETDVHNFVTPQLMNAVCSIWDVALFSDALKIHYAGGYWDWKQMICFECLSAVTDYLVSQGHSLRALDVTPYIYHYGGLTWGRWSQNSNFSVFNSRYAAITTRLKELGYSGDILVEDYV